MTTLLIKEAGKANDELTTVEVYEHNDLTYEIGMVITGEAKDENGNIFRVTGKIIEIA